MTEEAKRCVEALRDNINNGFLLVGGFNGSVHASEIIHLIESLSAQLEQVEKERDGLNIMLAQAQAMLETRTKERDAALADLKEADMIDCMHCKAYNTNIIPCQCDCENCKIVNCVCKTCVRNSNWQWRGVR